MGRSDRRITIICNCDHFSWACQKYSWKFLHEDIRTTINKINHNFIKKILGSDLTGGCMNPCLCNGAGLCSRGSHNKGAHPCVLACPGRGNNIGSMDIQFAS